MFFAVCNLKVRNSVDRIWIEHDVAPFLLQTIQTGYTSLHKGSFLLDKLPHRKEDSIHDNQCHQNFPIQINHPLYQIPIYARILFPKNQFYNVYSTAKAGDWRPIPKIFVLRFVVVTIQKKNTFWPLLFLNWNKNNKTEISGF